MQRRFAAVALETAAKEATRFDELSSTIPHRPARLFRLDEDAPRPACAVI
jgi:hypothetical protein